MTPYPQIFFPKLSKKESFVKSKVVKPFPKRAFVFLLVLNLLAILYAIEQNEYSSILISFGFSFLIYFLSKLRKNEVISVQEDHSNYTKSVGANIYYPNERKGISEDILLKALAIEFEDLIVFDRVIETFQNTKPYQPDLILHDPKSGIWFDIEIDEPYEIYSRKPIHYVSKDGKSIDARRNEYFLSKNWVIIRFTEAQVLNNPQGCVAIIGHILFEVLGYARFKKFGSQVWHLVPDSSPWTAQQAEILAKNNFREKMLRKYNLQRR